MKKITYWILATLSALVLLFSYRTSTGADVTVDSLIPTTAPAPSTSSGRASTTPSATPSASATPTDPAGSSDSSATASGLVDGTYTGDAVSTRYGDVQVQITVSGGVVSDVQVPVYPDNERRDVEINSRAIPVLVSETLSAQSAQVNMVSGATYTSRGYVSSLQSALDRAQR